MISVTTQERALYSLVLYTISNKRLFDTNNEIHKYKTRNNNNLHRPIANLSKFNKGAYISGIKVFNHLPQYINPSNAKLNPICHLFALLGAHHIPHVSRIRVKALTNDHKYFKSTLKRFLYHQSSYSMNEYYE